MTYKSIRAPQKTIPYSSYKKAITVKKTWWAPVWSGLVLDESAKHYKTMGTTIWLYLYLVTYANRQTGILFRKLPTIAKDMGHGVRTISRWLSRLRQNNYISTYQTGRSLKITVTKWKSIKRKQLP